MTFQVRCWLLLAITIAACSRGTPGLPDAEPGLHDAASAPDAPIPDTALANDQGVTADGPRPDSGIAPSCLRMPDAFPPSS